MPRYEYPAGRHPGCRPIRHPGARPKPHEQRVQARISPRCNGPGGRTESIRPLRAPGSIPAHVSSARESRSPIVRRPTRPSVSTRLAGSPAPHIFRSSTCTSTPVPGPVPAGSGRRMPAPRIPRMQGGGHDAGAYRLLDRGQQRGRCFADHFGRVFQTERETEHRRGHWQVSGPLLSPSSRCCAARCIRCGSRAETRSRHRRRASRSERCA
jgi:hypothetical protein